MILLVFAELIGDGKEALLIRESTRRGNRHGPAIYIPNVELVQSFTTGR